MGHIYVESCLRGVSGEKTAKVFVDTGSTFSIIPVKLGEELGVQRAPWREKVSLADRSVKEFEVAFVYFELLERGTVAKVLLSEVDEPAIGVETLETLGLKVDPVAGKVEPSRSWKARAPSRIQPPPQEDGYLWRALAMLATIQSDNFNSCDLANLVKAETDRLHALALGSLLRGGYTAESCVPSGRITDLRGIELVQ